MICPKCGCKNCDSDAICVFCLDPLPPQGANPGQAGNHEPLRLNISRQEAIEAACRWTREHYPDPDRRHVALGMLVDFLTDLIPDEKETNPK